MSIKHEHLPTLYRPKSFKEVIGQPLAVSLFKKLAMCDGIVARSVFVKGFYGSGKTTLARIFGKALNCRNFKKLGDVCNECPECIEAESATSQTYYEFDSAAVGNVESVKSMLDRLSLYNRGRRLVCMDEIHAASKQSLNMLLKVVEEGIPNTMFMFVSTEDILNTLKSRSLVVEINLIPPVLMKERLKEIIQERNINITNSDLDILVSKSKGHMRDALSLLQLYEFVGVDALATSYEDFRQFIIKCFSKEKKHQALDHLERFLKFSLVDQVLSINNYIKEIFISEEGSLEYLLKQRGMGIKIFDFFYTPTAQQAMKDEQGIEILLRSFYERLNRG